MISGKYQLLKDPVIKALKLEAINDPDVAGLVVLGSRAVDAPGIGSDYDVVFLVTKPKKYPDRGVAIIPAIDTSDIISQTLDSVRPERVVEWMLPAWAESRVVFDRDGSCNKAVDKLRKMPARRARQECRQWYDAYLNSLYRSLKAWRRGNELGGRLQAAESADHLVRLLFALEGRWKPYSDRLELHLKELSSQGWKSGELRKAILKLVTGGEPVFQQRLAKRIVALLKARGHGRVFKDWDGKIDEALSWEL